MAASATVGILRVLLSANSAEFESAMKAAAKTADAFAKDLGSLSKQATAIGGTLTKALTVPLVGIAAASIKSAMTFESSFAGIRKTVDGVVDSAGNLTAAGAQMQQAMRDLAKTIPVNVDALNRLGETAGALGIPRDKVVDFAKVMAELGVTTNLTADQAADAIARIQNIFGAAGQNTDRLASTLVALGNAGASTEQEIVEMAQRIAGAGHTVGLTQAQVLAFASTLASVGINAEAGGSAISRVFLKINDAVAKGGSGLNEFARVAGMSAAQFKQAFEKDAAGATQAFIEGIARIKASGENVNGTIEHLIGKNIILKDTLLRVSGAGSLLSDQLKLANQAWSDNTALTKEAEQRFKTTESQLAVLWNRIKDVGITLGNALLPGINAAISGFNVLLPVVDTLAKGFAALPGGAQLVVVGFGALLAAAGPALLVFGQLASAAQNVTALFGKKGIATRLLAGDLIALEGASTKVTGALGFLGRAASVAGAAFIGWQIGRLIADLTGLDQKISDTLTGLNNLTRARQLAASGDRVGAEAEVSARLLDLERQRTQAIQAHNLAGAALLVQQIETLKNDQTRLAIQDTINKAIRGGAAANIDYAGAIKFNEEAVRKQQAAQAAANAETTKGAAAADATGKSVSALAQLNAAYAADLKKIGTSGFKEIQQAHETYGKSVKDLAAQYGVAESSIDHYIDGTHKAATATKAAAKEADAANGIFDRFVKTAKNLEMQLQAAADAGVPMSIVLEEFGSQIEDVTHKAPIFGQAIGDATKAAADALKNSDLAKASAKLMAELNADARKLVADWQKAGSDAGEKLAVGLAKSNKKFLDDAAGVQKGLIGLEKDSLQKRLDLIKLEFDERRRALDKNGVFYKDQLEILNAEEAKALKAGTKTWQEEGDKRVEAMASSLSGLSQAFSQLAQISGDSFGGIVKSIGQLIAGLSVALVSTKQLMSSIQALGQAGGKTATNWTQLAASGVALGGSLWGSTNPEGRSTGKNVAAGAVTWGLAGATIGLNPGLMAATGGTSVLWGAALGALTGALVGWWRSSHQQWRAIGEQVGDWLGAPISEKLAKQIDEVRKTLEGGTKDQRQKWAALISLPDIIGEQGGLRSDNIGVFETQAKGLFEIIQRGGANAKQAYDTLNTLAGQFADYADTAGGMWDQTFKDLIAQSKALGVNLQSVNEAIQKQVSKLSGGLGLAVSGAFTRVDAAYAKMIEGLDPDKVKALDLSSLVDGAQPAFDRLTRTALASFNAIVASGRTAADAMAQIGSAVDTLIAEHDRLGLAGGAAYDQLARFRGLTKDNEALVASVGGLNDVMTALSNLGGLNVETLADLEAQGLDTFGQLQAAGFTESESLKQMVPFIENVIKAHAALGIPIDENTQKLIDQANAQGLLSDEAMSTNDILMEGFAALIEAVGGDLPEAFKKFRDAAVNAAKDAGKAINDIPTSKTVDIDVNYRDNYPDSGDEDNGRRYASGGVVTPQYATTGSVVGQAMGRLVHFTPKGTDTVPAMLTPKEGVVSLAGMDRLGADGLDALNGGKSLPGRILSKLIDPALLRTAAAIGTLAVGSSMAPAAYMPTHADVQSISHSWAADSAMSRGAPTTDARRFEQPITLHMPITVNGDVTKENVDRLSANISRDIRDITIQMAKQLRLGGAPRSAWQQEIVGMVKGKV